MHELGDEICAGNRRALAQAITLVESTRPEHRAAAAELLARLMPTPHTAIRLGITGAPGVGKSTFIEAFGLHLLGTVGRVSRPVRTGLETRPTPGLSDGEEGGGISLAVLTIDPSSARSGGSILGDKTRMENLSRHPQAFIRPSPSGGVLGGVARRTHEAIVLCEVAGFDVVIVETVGVGQSETAVADMVDMFLLLVAPAAGDDLQGIKRGIMELADLVIVNKADGELLSAAQRTAADYRLALGLLRPSPREGDWRPTVELCSALTGAGVPKIWELVRSRHEACLANGELTARRATQARDGMWAELSENLMAAFKANPKVVKELGAIEAQVAAGQLSPTVAAQRLLEQFLTASQTSQ